MSYHTAILATQKGWTKLMLTVCLFALGLSTTYAQEILPEGTSATGLIEECTQTDEKERVFCMIAKLRELITPPEVLLQPSEEELQNICRNAPELSICTGIKDAPPIICDLKCLLEKLRGSSGSPVTCDTNCSTTDPERHQACDMMRKIACIIEGAQEEVSRNLR